MEFITDVPEVLLNSIYTDAHMHVQMSISACMHACMCMYVSGFYM